MILETSFCLLYGSVAWWIRFGMHGLGAGTLPDSLCACGLSLGPGLHKQPVPFQNRATRRQGQARGIHAVAFHGESTLNRHLCPNCSCSPIADCSWCLCQPKTRIYFTMAGRKNRRIPQRPTKLQYKNQSNSSTISRYPVQCSALWTALPIRIMLPCPFASHNTYSH